MTTILRNAAATGALLAALALPVGSQAATTSTSTPQSYVFQTRLTESLHPGEYDGTMRVTLYPSGIVSGTFQDSEGHVRNVAGGFDGTAIWLDIGGTAHTVHLDGTFKNGVISATANIPGPDTYTFVATVHPKSN